MLGENKLAVGHDIEDALVAFYQLSRCPKPFLDRGRQTGGLGKVVSSDTVRNRYLHANPSDCCATDRRSRDQDGDRMTTGILRSVRAW